MELGTYRYREEDVYDTSIDPNDDWEGADEIGEEKGLNDISLRS